MQYSWKREQIKQRKAYIKDHIIFTIICIVVSFGFILVQIKIYEW